LKFILHWNDDTTMETYSVLTNGKLRFVLMETLESKRICEMPPRSFDETSGLLVHYQSTGADHTFQAPYGTMTINNQEVIHRRHADKEWIDARIILAAGKGHCHMAVEQGDAYYSLESFQPVTPDATKEFVLSYNIHPSYSGDRINYSALQMCKHKLLNYEYIYK